MYDKSSQSAESATHLRLKQALVERATATCLCIAKNGLDRFFWHAETI